MNIDNLNLTSDPAVQYGPALSRDIPAVSEEEFDETIRRAIKTYGKDSQTQMLFEEMAELQEALCKLARGRLRCSPGSCREEMRGRVILRYGETSAQGFPANLGGTTERCMPFVP